MPSVLECIEPHLRLATRGSRAGGFPGVAAIGFEPGGSQGGRLAQGHGGASHGTTLQAYMLGYFCQETECL